MFKKLQEKIHLLKNTLTKKIYAVPLLLGIGILTWEYGLEEKIYGPETIYGLTKEDLESVAKKYPIKYVYFKDSEGESIKTFTGNEYLQGLCYNSLIDRILNNRKILINKDLQEIERDIVFIHESLHALYPSFSEFQVDTLEDYFVKQKKVMNWSREVRHKYYNVEDLEDTINPNPNRPRHF